MKARLRIALLAAAACAVAWPALAQQGRGRPGGAPGMKAYPQAQRPMQSPAGMSQEERERFRRELNSARRDVYREPGRSPEFDPRRLPQRPMPPEERERLRRDILDANRDFERRR